MKNILEGTGDGISSVKRRDNGHKGTVIVAEDYDDNRDMMRLWLELCGYQVVEARDGIEAISAVLLYDPDLILMDLGLPKVDGLEATRRIRAIAAVRELPIVAVTGYCWEPYIKAAREAGCNECVIKPIDLEELESIMTELLAA